MILKTLKRKFQTFSLLFYFNLFSLFFSTSSLIKNCPFCQEIKKKKKSICPGVYTYCIFAPGPFSNIFSPMYDGNFLLFPVFSFSQLFLLTFFKKTNHHIFHHPKLNTNTPYLASCQGWQPKYPPKKNHPKWVFFGYSGFFLSQRKSLYTL